MSCIFTFHFLQMFLTETEKGDIVRIFRFFNTYKKNILFFSLISAMIGLVISFLMSPKYNSKAVIFAINYADLEKNSANMPFGLDIHADQLMQILISDRLKDSVITHCNLAKHYGILLNEQGGREKVYAKWASSVKMQKTRFLSIEIVASTTSPQLSADIANAIIFYADKIYNEILDENELALFKQLSQKYEQQNAEIKVLGDSLALLLLQKRDTFTLNRLKERIRNLDHFTNTDTKKQYEYAKSRLEKKTVVLNVVDKAMPASKSSSPSFVLNILIGATLGGVFTILFSLTKAFNLL